MTKARTYGEQVRVRLFSQDGLTPFVIDFDSIDIEELSKNRTNRAIGKKVSSHQRYGNDGWKIVLTRSKRDNYIQSLFHYNEQFLQKGLDAPKFQIEHITTHTYNTANINPFLEFSLDNVLQTSISPAFLLSRVNIPIPKEISQTATNIQSAVGNIANKVLGNFRERFIYHDCTITPLTASDKVKENNIETITLYATSRTDESDNNLYSDSYTLNNMNKQLVSQIRREDSKPKTDIVFNLNKIANDKIDSLQLNINSALQKIYDNLKINL